MNSLTRTAPAKLNLALRVRGRRADGYHDIESLVARLSLADTVAVAKRADGRLTLECDGAGVPTDASNLALRAARVLAQAAGVRAGAHIQLTKRIPPGSGLGGGSSDAATTLLLLNQLWRLDWPQRDLVRVAAEIGSDVPLFLHGARCLLRGRGELVEDVPMTRPYWAALVLPEIHCSTPAVYAAWDCRPTRTAQLPIADLLAAQGSASGLMDLLFNDLEESAYAVAPELGELSRNIANRCGQPVRMTGSGSALFRLYEDARAAAQFALAVGIECAVRTDVVSLPVC